jgi:hypothetical protein
VERAFKRGNISTRNEITEFSSKFERLRFAICRGCFDAEIGLRYVRRVEWCGMSAEMPIYLNQERNNRVFVESDEGLRSAICRGCFDAEIGLRYVRRIEWSGKSV